LKQCKQEKFQLLIQNGLAYQVGRSEVLPPGSLKFSMLQGLISPNFLAKQKVDSARHSAKNLPFNFTNKVKG
jgi:hypothetical protein